jgi:ABC-type glutathione transport system ATPase component
MIYNEEDVAELKKRAQVLAMLTRSDNVTAEQLALLRQLCEKEQRVNAVNAPALAHYQGFLEGVLALHERDKQEQRQRLTTLQQQLNDANLRVQTLQEHSDSARRQTESNRVATLAKSDETRLAETRANALRSKLLAMDELTSKLPLDVDVSNLVQVCKKRKETFVLRGAVFNRRTKRWRCSEQNLRRWRRSI